MITQKCVLRMTIKDNTQDVSLQTNASKPADKKCLLQNYDADTILPKFCTVGNTSKQHGFLSRDQILNERQMV